MERCKNCGAVLYDDDDKCDFCGNAIAGRQRYNPESYNQERFEENFNEYHETIDCDCEKPEPKDSFVVNKETNKNNNSFSKSVGKYLGIAFFILFFTLVLVSIYLGS